MTNTLIILRGALIGVGVMASFFFVIGGLALLATKFEYHLRAKGYTPMDAQVIVAMCIILFFAAIAGGAFSAVVLIK